MLEFYNGKKVLVTGHTGFKGTWLCQILLHAGANVVGFALPAPTDPSLFEIINTEKNIVSHIGDIRNRGLLKNVIEQESPDLIFHLAAQPLVRLSYKEPVQTYEINVMGTLNVLEALRKTPSVRSFVNVTTDKVYENKEWIWGYRENEPLCGYDPYSNSKSCSELITYSYRKSFFNNDDSPAISTVRSGNVIGGGDFALDRIIPDCVRAALAGEEIIIRNPYSTRPYQHVLECLSGYLLLAEKQYQTRNLAGAYNFGPNEESCVTTGKLVEMFCSAWEGTSWRIQGDRGPHEANFLKLDNSKAKETLGWKPKWSIEKAIEKTIEWTRAYQHKTNVLKCITQQINEYFSTT